MITPLPRRLPRRLRRRLVRGLSLAGLWLAASAGPALAATNYQPLSFSSGQQSLWGPGGSAGFGGSDYVLGKRSFGVSYDARAASGTVRSSVDSALAARFDNSVAFDQRSAVGIDFWNKPLSGQFSTDLGASISVTGHLNLTLAGVPIGWNPDIVDYDYRLDIDRSFTPALDAKASGSDAFSPVSVGIGLPTFGIGLSGGAGVDLDVRQTAALELTGLSGLVAARHRDSGALVTRTLSLTSLSAQNLSFDLGQAGFWDFSYLDLSLASRFSTQFGLDIRPYIEYGVGVSCGDLGSDDDNFLCTDDRLSTRLTGINLFSSPELAMAYGELDTGTAFSVQVMAAPVPEPATALLMLAGAGALLSWRRGGRGIGRGAD